MGFELEVIVPLYNEEAILRRNARALARGLDEVVGAGRWQFLFVDNGSTDGTREIIDDLIVEFGAGRAVHAPQPNYGLALRAGLKEATAPFVHLCDVEQWDIPFLAWAWQNRHDHDLFIGSRRSDPTVSHQPTHRRILSWGLNSLIQVFFGYMGTDTHGPKLLNRSKLQPVLDVCTCDRGQYDSEIVLRATRAGLRVAEAPIEHEEHRRPRFLIIKKVAWNLVAFNRLRRIMRKVPYADAVHFHQFSRTDVRAAFTHDPSFPESAPALHRASGSRSIEVSSGGRLRRWANAGLIALVIVMAVLTYVRGDALEMKEKVSNQFSWYYVPIALTYIVGGGPFDYTANATLMDAFTKSYFGAGDAGAALRSALDTKDIVLATREAKNYVAPWFVWGNDKGGALYAVAAYRVFDVSSSALYNFYFLILGVTVLMFLVSYRKEPFKLLTLFCVLLALFALAKPISMGGDQLGAFHAQRALPTLALVPCLYLVFAALERPSRGRVVLILFQAIVLVFVLFIRSAALWGLLAVFAATFVAMMVDWRAIWQRLRAHWARGLISAGRDYMIPVCAVLIAFAGLQAHKAVAFHPRYFDDLETTRVLWHNAYIGLGRHEAIADELWPTGTFGDAGVAQALEVYLKKNGRGEEWDRLVAPVKSGKIGNIYAVAQYDELVKDMYLSAWQRFPSVLPRVYLFAKPLAFFGSLMSVWAPRGEAAEEDLFSKGLKYGAFHSGTPWHIGALILLAAAIGLFRLSGAKPRARDWIGAGALALFPQLTWFAAYPSFGATPTPYIVATFVFYLLVAMGVSVLIGGVLYSAKRLR